MRHRSESPDRRADGDAVRCALRDQLAWHERTGEDALAHVRRRAPAPKGPTRAASRALRVGKPSDPAFAFGGIQLVRNADGNGLRYADTTVRVEHPEIVESSVYAGSDVPDRVTVLIVNKNRAPRTFGLRVFDGARLSSSVGARNE